MSNRRRHIEKQPAIREGAAPEQVAHQVGRAGDGGCRLAGDQFRVGPRSQADRDSNWVVDSLGLGERLIDDAPGGGRVVPQHQPAERRPGPRNSGDRVENRCPFNHTAQLGDALLDLAGIGGDQRSSGLELEGHCRHAELVTDRRTSSERFDRTLQIIERTACLAEHPVQGDGCSPGRRDP